MELRHLRYFLAVAQEKHFGRAAARLHMAQPPLSQQIRQLEAELGVTLLIRSTRRVELTPAGAVFFDRASKILDSVSGAARDAALAAEEGSVGQLAVGFTGSATYELLPLVARRVQAALPRVTLKLCGELFTGQQEAALEAGELDVGFLRPPVRTSLLEVSVIRSEPLVVVLCEDHPLAGSPEVALADLAGEPFVCYPDDRYSVVHDIALEACHRAGFTPRVVQEAKETSTMVAAAAGGVGVALLPASVRLAVDGAVYRPLVGSAVRVELAVAHRRGDHNPALRRFLALLPSILDATDDARFKPPTS
jgi:DNA-binding transcriptional LysR family regulator